MALTPTRVLRALLCGVLIAGLFALPKISATAHPEACDGKSADEEVHDEECMSEEETRGFDDSGADLEPGEVARTRNVHHVANLPKSGPFAGESNFGSDLAFWGKYAFQGNYNGIQITDISEPEAPRIVSQIFCPGAQNDVSVWGNLLFASVDSSRNMAECVDQNGNPNVFQSATIKSSWEGIRIFDWSDPADPKYVGAVETDCGSHTHTLLPDVANDRALLYVSSYSPSASFPDCRPPHDKISIVSVPLSNPAAASVVATPVLFPDGGRPSGTGRATDGCHDITVYPALNLAAGACTGQGAMLDISNPLNPVKIADISDPNFAFWHSATFFNNGTKVLFTDELGGGGGPTCNPTIGPRRGANAIYDISDPRNPVFLSYYKIPRTQSNTENCVAHNGMFLPTPDRDIYVQSWYQGGTSFVDLTDARNPREIGFFDRGPLSNERLILGGTWSTYYYNGFAYSNDIQQGLDVFKFSDSSAAKASGVKLPYLNAQTQEPLQSGPRRR
ncbi:MAG TPA: hypothetical protein VM784_11490 [Actinomycetota bacterium]|nr:hypothetical protein [Actinomycetota bacterium]